MVKPWWDSYQEAARLFVQEGQVDKVSDCIISWVFEGMVLIVLGEGWLASAW